MKPTIKQQRIMRYFIESTQKVAAIEGIQKITIRNVAEGAGYNSATLYNYFENLEQLIAFAMIDSIREYLSHLRTIQNLEENSLKKFLLSWRNYAERSFMNPEVYTYVFDSDKSDYVLSQIDDFFRLFDLSNNEYSGLVTEQRLKDRDELLISPCIKDNYFLAEEKEYIMKFCYVVHSGIINQITKGHIKNPEFATERFLDYITEFLNHHLIDRGNAKLTSQYVLTL